MPLQLYTRPNSPYLWVRGTVGSRKVRESTRTADRKKAEEFRAKLEGDLYREGLYGPKSVATFADAVIAYKAEGGARSERDEVRVAKLLEHFGPDKKLTEIGQESLAGAYEACLRDGADTGPGGKLRGVFAPLHAVMEAAALHGSATGRG